MATPKKKKQQKQATPESLEADLRARLEGDGVPKEVIDQVVEQGRKLGAFESGTEAEVCVTQLPAEIADDPLKAVIVGLTLIARAAGSFGTMEEFMASVSGGARSAMTMHGDEVTAKVMMAIAAGLAVGTCLAADFETIKEHELTPHRFIQCCETLFGDEDGFYEMVDRMKAEQESAELTKQFAMDCDADMPEEERC